VPTRPRPTRRRALGWVAALAVLVVVLAGCRTTARVGVDVRPDGSGTVTVSVVLDAQAAAQLGDPSRTVPLGDLATAGWKVAAAAKDGDGLCFSGTRAFTSPRQLPAVLAEVGGTDGVFRDVRLAVDDGTFGTSYSFRARVVLSGDPSQFSDADLTKTVGGFALGRTPEELTASGATAPGAATLVVSVELPGDAPETNGTVRGGRAEWSFPVSGGTATDARLRSASSDTDPQVIVLAAVGAGLLVLALVVLVVGLVRTRRRT
jgi:hypothetical protein